MSKRKELNFVEKFELLKQYDALPKSSQREAALKLGISQPSLNHLLKQRSEINLEILKSGNVSRKRKRYGKCLKVETALLDWYRKVQYEQKNPIQTCVLLKKASEIARNLNLEFVPTNGWLSRWKQRHNLVTNISGPYSSGANLKNVDPSHPSTSSYEEILPDVGDQRDSEIVLGSTNSAYDPNIVIKEEVFETEVDPSTVFDHPTCVPSEHLPLELISTLTTESSLQETVPGSLKSPVDISLDSLNTNKNLLLPVAKRHKEVAVPVTAPKFTKSPVESSEHSKKSVVRKLPVKKSGKPSPNPSEGSSDEDEVRRRPRDKFDAYAEFIASKLRDLDPRSCAFVQTAIADLIFEAELGRFLSEGDKSIFAARTQELLKKMPTPCENKA